MADDLEPLIAKVGDTSPKDEITFDYRPGENDDPVDEITFDVKPNSTVPEPSYGEEDYGKPEMKDLDLYDMTKNFLKQYSDPDQRIAIHQRMSSGVSEVFTDPALLLAHISDKQFGTNFAPNVQKKVDQLEKARADAQELNKSTGVDLIAKGAKLGYSMGALAKLKVAGTLTGKIAQGMGLGGYFGATEYKPEEGQEYSLEDALDEGINSAVFGALVAPGVDLGVKAVAGGTHVAKKMFSKQGDASGILNKLIPSGAKRTRAINELRKADSGVHGVKLTAGQAGAKARVTELSAMQKVAEKAYPTKYLDKTVLQEELHKKAIGSIAKTGGGVAKATAHRTAESTKAYQKAYGAGITANKSDKGFQAMSQNPYFLDATKKADKLAKAEGISFETNPTRYMHFVKTHLDKKMIIKGGDEALDTSEKEIVRKLKTQVVEWTKDKNALYDKARISHANLSEPINQAAIGEQLMEALTKPVGSELRKDAFGKLVNKLGKDINPHTGKPIIDSLTTSQRKIMRDVLMDLKRNSIMERQAKAGMKNVAEKTQAFQLIPLGMLDPRMSVSRVWFNKLAGKLNTKGMEFISKNMDNPKLIADLIEKSSPEQEKAISQLFSKMLAQSIIIGKAQNKEDK